jgi:O-antigen/teichoic acid export membrane protein
MMPLQKFKLAYSSTTIRYSLVTYSAILLNALSGVALARSLGASERGILAYYLNFLLLSSFLSGLNFSNATARSLPNTVMEKSTNSQKLFTSIIMLGFALSFASALFINEILVKETYISRFYFFLLLFSNGVSALMSYFDGFWRYTNSIAFLSITRFTGLAAPSILTLLILFSGHSTLEKLLLSQIFAAQLNLIIIFIFQKKHTSIVYPTITTVLKSALLGFPTYCLEYIVVWIVPFLIIHIDGATTLGWYSVALSFALLADVAYGAIEAKNYRKLLDLHNSKSLNIVLFIKNISPIIVMHLIFIPLTFSIPLIFGEDFQKSVLFSFVLVLTRIPIVLARSIISYLISISMNSATLFIYASFLATFIYICLKTNIVWFGFHWIPAYVLSSLTMVLFTVLAFAKVQIGSRR